MSSIELEPQDLPDPAAPNHGITPAAVVLNAGVVLGVLIASVGMMIEVNAVTWTGVGVVVVSLVTGGVLRALGYGQPLR